MNQTTRTIHADEQYQLTAKLGPVGAVGEVTWSIVEESHEGISVNNKGKVTVAKTATVGQTATVKATVGEASATCVITVAAAYNYGSEESPLDPEQAKALIDTLVADDFNYSSHVLWVRGYAETNAAYDTEAKTHNEVWLTNNDGSVAKYFELYGVEYAEGLTPVAAENGLRGKIITAAGYATYYAPSEIYELTKSNNTKPQIKAIANGDRVPASIQIGDGSASIDVDQGDEKALTAAVLPYGATYTDAIVWSVSGNDNVTVDAQTGVVSVARAAVAGSKATVTATLGTSSVVGSVEIVVKKSDGMEIVANPVAGVNYKLGVQTKNSELGENLYLNGAKDSWKLATTNDVEQAKDVQLVASGDGFKLRFTMAENSQKFLQVVANGNNRDMNFIDSADDATVFSYNADAKTFTVNITGHTDSTKDGVYYLGTYTNKGSTYNTVTPSLFSYIQGSSASKIDASQFPLHCYAAAA